MTRLGDLEVSVLPESLFWLDGGAMFGVVPRTLWSRCTAPDERNRIRLAGQGLLVRGHGRTILVDTGCGDKDDEKFRAIYGIELCDGGLVGSLSRVGVTPEDVTDVVYTHLHFDHAGGGTRRDGTGTAVPTFPRATYHVQRRQWDWGLAPTERDRASYMNDNLLPIQAAGRLNLVDGDTELFPDVTVLCDDNHCVGHQTVTFRSGGETLVHCGDLIPTSHHVRLPYIMAYDLFPLGTLEGKKRLLERAADEGWILVFEHDPDLPAARVRRGAKGIELGEPVVLVGEA